MSHHFYFILFFAVYSQILMLTTTASVLRRSWLAFTPSIPLYYTSSQGSSFRADWPLSQKSAMPTDRSYKVITLQFPQITCGETAVCMLCQVNCPLHKALLGLYYSCPCPHFRLRPAHTWSLRPFGEKMPGLQHSSHRFFNITSHWSDWAYNKI